MSLKAAWDDFYANVLKRGWPDTPALELVVKLAFYGGALIGAKLQATNPEKLEAEQTEFHNMLHTRKRELCPHWPDCGCGTQSGPHACVMERGKIQ